MSLPLPPLQFTQATRLGAGFFVATVCFCVAYAIGRSGTYPGEPLVLRYEAYLERTSRRLFLEYKPKQIILGQALGIVVSVLGYARAEDTRLWIGLLLASLTGPFLKLMSERMKRRALFDEQADNFIVSLANSLKAVASVGAALHSIMAVVQNPVKQEMALALNEMRLGSTIEQALLNAAARSESPAFDSAISALLVGRQVGGNLPTILESTAASLREINRLERVIQTKTSEGRAQMWVLSLFPAGVIFAFRFVNPDYFDPLQYSDLGHMVAGVIGLLWFGAIMLARGIAKVRL